MAGVPDSIKAIARMSPVEDVVVPILRDGLPGIPVKTLIERNPDIPFILVRRINGPMNYGGDERFIDIATVAVHAFAEDPNGDEDAAWLAEAARVVLFNAWRDNVEVPGRGRISHFQCNERPRRVSDWATSSGPVQYADLPTGVWRYEARYLIEIRSPINLTLS